tara:strand:+ start:2414 stop:2743 length:330 start_codon:yes stop_codon:yes gene_type:complete
MFDFDEMSSSLEFSNMEKTLEGTLLVKEIQEDIKVFRECFDDMIKSGNVEKLEPFYLAFVVNIDDKLERLPKVNISNSRTLKVYKSKIKTTLEKIGEKIMELSKKGGDI